MRTNPTTFPRESGRFFVLRLYLLFLFHTTITTTTNTHNKNTAVMGYGLYGIQHPVHPQRSLWTSPDWHWGYAQGQGHECAKICRQQYANEKQRKLLIQELLNSEDEEASCTTSFEEIKLILALAWQRGRWDGSDGGPEGYGQVLRYMAQAERYESLGSEKECSIRLIMDMKDRFHLIQPSEEDLRVMNEITDECINLDYKGAQRKCSGLVLKNVGFVEVGI